MTADAGSKKMRFSSENRILPFIEEESRKLQQLIKLNEEKKREIDLMITQKFQGGGQSSSFRSKQTVPNLLSLISLDPQQLTSLKKIINSNSLLAKSIENYTSGLEKSSPNRVVLQRSVS